jgi:hypothetical protein
MGEWRHSSTILDLGTRWRWVVSFTPQPLYPQYPLDGRLGGPQIQSGCCGEEKNLLLLPVQGPLHIYTHLIYISFRNFFLFSHVHFTFTFTSEMCQKLLTTVHCICINNITTYPKCFVHTIQSTRPDIIVSSQQSCWYSQNKVWVYQMITLLDSVIKVCWERKQTWPAHSTSNYVFWVCLCSHTVLL